MNDSKNINIVSKCIEKGQEHIRFMKKAGNFVPSLRPNKITSALHTWCNINVYHAYHDNIQGMVDGSASKPALRQDTGYMVEKTYYDIAQFLWGLLGPI